MTIYLTQKNFTCQPYVVWCLGLILVTMAPAMVTTTTTTTVNGLKESAFVCPQAADIEPCTCLSEPLGLFLQCQGDPMTPDDVSRLLSLTKLMNDENVDPGQPYSISKFEILNTPLATLDLTEFQDCRFGGGGLKIVDNPQLTEVTLPTLPMNLVYTTTLTLQNSSLDDRNVANLLQSFSTVGVFGIDLSWNKIRGFANNRMWTQLSKFTDLSMLSLEGNQLTTLEGGQFQGMTKLIFLELQNNKLVSLGKDAFLFNQPWFEYVEVEPLVINLADNELQDRQVHGIYGLPNTERVTTLSLQNNEFTTLSRIFEIFLYSNPTNQLAFEGSPFFCDPSLKWMRDGADDFQHRVTGTTCTNDPLHDVFTSDLVTGNATTTTTTEAATTDTSDTTTTTTTTTTRTTESNKNSGVQMQIHSAWVMVALFVVVMTKVVTSY